MIKEFPDFGGGYSFSGEEISCPSLSLRNHFVFVNPVNQWTKEDQGPFPDGNKQTSADRIIIFTHILAISFL